MCSVSATYDYFRTNVPVVNWTPDSWAMFKEIIDKLDELDNKLNQKDCHDPSKAKWVREVEKRLKKLEKQADVE